jgi:transcriptional regulator with XRE-family HTH domain
MSYGDPRRNYAQEWRAWRTAHGLTQHQLAQALGRSPRAIEYIEAGSHRPSVTSREKMKALQQRYKEAQA